MATALDHEASELARTLARLGSGEKARVYRMSWWSDQMLGWAMSHPSFKTQLFRFVDVFPATTGDTDVLRHIEEYFEGTDAPRLLELGIDVADRLPGGDRLSASIARRNITRMAHQFIVGEEPAQAVEGLHRLWRQGAAATVDLLGEKTVTEEEADRYAARAEELLRTLVAAAATWAPDDHLDSDDLGQLPRANVSIKPTALSSLYAPLTADEGLALARRRLLPLLELAAAEGAFVWFDMEHYDVKDLTLELFRDLVGDPRLADLQAGVVLQAYLKDSHADLVDILDWARALDRPVPIGVRLVKGAYWDFETVTAEAEGWPIPVFEEKVQTDANYERCTRLLHDHHGTVRAAFGTHNLRSLAYAVSYARAVGVPDTGYELQMLYGMAEPVQAAVRRLGLRLRIYAPVGQLVPGMAYLVRRLLENTSNESFVRHRFAEGWSLEELIAPPEVAQLPGPEPPVRRPPTDVDDPGPYRHEPLAEWRRAEVTSAFARAVATLPDSFGQEVPAIIDGERVRTHRSIVSVDPADTDTVVATSASCGVAEADVAVEVAVQSAGGWRRTPARDRAAVLFRASEWMRARRRDLAALEVFEAGKPWAEADADVGEAIDFFEYYGREILRLDRGGAVESRPGESNVLRYQGKGVTVVIAPWNFPLAIPAGMVGAALVTGNPVVFKPAEQTPAVAYRLVEALEAGGLPSGVLALLPGIGEEVGAHLVEHPDVAMIVFTGSKAVGLHINQAAAVLRPGQRHVKRVVAEMGGKNALVVDADADLDQAVPAVAQSAFGYAGQKCSAASRLVVVDAVYDQLVDRLVRHTRDLPVGHPRDGAVKVGPVIDADAWKRVRSYVESAPQEGTVLLARQDVPDHGYFVGPTIVADVALESPLATEEIFGPVLTVFRAGDFDEALAVANHTEYALTAGVFSRSPTHIARAATELQAGNVYVNRGITGAVVGHQPFGGYGLSGVGSKAGGPDYLLQFLDPRVVTENTLRQGFAPGQ
ncbi:MAG TPA: L-glutamate gamma-semialdehyde dehydrogenase [Acidimicrobiales bacterium]|nr:L-glutamate gamma-semialdehyde dehydrogenase [Acidimicrobiales bacterium]